MNKLRYGGIRGGKLVIVRAKVIAWSHVRPGTVYINSLIRPTEACVGNSEATALALTSLLPFYEHILLHTNKNDHI